METAVFPKDLSDHLEIFIGLLCRLYHLLGVSDCTVVAYSL